MKHFKGVEIPTLSGCKSIDFLIGQNDKLLLVVLEEREGSNSEEPHYVLTRLGPIASGGCVHAGSKSHSNLKVQINKNCKDCELLKRENIALKEAAHANEIENETLQSSKNDEIARKLIETNVKVVNDRYEFSVPLKYDVAEKLPNNYSNEKWRQGNQTHLYTVFVVIIPLLVIDKGMITINISPNNYVLVLCFGIPFQEVPIFPFSVFDFFRLPGQYSIMIK